MILTGFKFWTASLRYFIIKIQKCFDFLKERLFCRLDAYIYTISSLIVISDSGRIDAKEQDFWWNIASIIFTLKLCDFRPRISRAVNFQFCLHVSFFEILSNFQMNRRGLIKIRTRHRLSLFKIATNSCAFLLRLWKITYTALINF